MSKDVKRTKRNKITAIVVIAAIAVLLIVGIILTDPLYQTTEDISEVMKDAVLHEENKVSLFGYEVNPAYISSIAVVLLLLGVALVIRIFAVPRFKLIPGKFQPAARRNRCGHVRRYSKEEQPSPKRFIGRVRVCRRLLYRCRHNF